MYFIILTMFFNLFVDNGEFGPFYHLCSQTQYIWVDNPSVLKFSIVLFDVI